MPNVTRKTLDIGCVAIKSFVEVDGELLDEEELQETIALAQAAIKLAQVVLEEM